MFKKLTPFMVLALLVGCSSYGKVNVRDDEFTNSRFVTMTFSGTSKDGSGFSKKSHFIESKLTNEIIKGKSNYKIEFSVNLDDNDSDLGDKTFIKVDDTVFNMTLLNTKSSIETNTSTSTSNSYGYKPQNYGYTDYTKQNNSTTTTTTTTSTYSYKVATGELQLSNEILSAITNGKVVVIRLYSGTDPITLTLDEKNLFYIQNFYQTK